MYGDFLLDGTTNRQFVLYVRPLNEHADGYWCFADPAKAGGHGMMPGIFEDLESESKQQIIPNTEKVRLIYLLTHSLTRVVVVVVVISLIQK